MRELHKRLDAAFARADRSTASISLLLIDFDYFKSVNDELGHQHGDLVLQLGARIARSAARAQDSVARYGGDELAVPAPDTSAGGDPPPPPPHPRARPSAPGGHPPRQIPDVPPRLRPLPGGPLPA